MTQNVREAMGNVEREQLLVSVPRRGIRSALHRPGGRRAPGGAGLAETTAPMRVPRRWKSLVRDAFRDSSTVLGRPTRRRSFRERVKAVLAFHEAIWMGRAGNETLLALWRSLIGNITVMVLNVGPERMTALQDPAEHQRLFDAIASRNEVRIRKVFADVFEDGRREVAAAVAERDEAAVAMAAE